MVSHQDERHHILTDEYHHHHHTALDKTGNLSLLVARTDYVDVLC